MCVSTGHLLETKGKGPGHSAAGMETWGDQATPSQLSIGHNWPTCVAQAGQMQRRERPQMCHQNIKNTGDSPRNTFN